MKKILSMILALALLAGCAAALAETAAETAGCLIPATATARFDAALEELLPGEAAQYRLSADTGFMNLTYNSQRPAVTFSFEFPEGTEKSETAQASMMSFMMFGEMPEDTEKAILACFIRTMPKRSRTRFSSSRRARSQWWGKGPDSGCITLSGRWRTAKPSRWFFPPT